LREYRYRTQTRQDHALPAYQPCPVNTVDLSRLIRPDLRASLVWLIRLGCAQIGYLSAAVGSSVTLSDRRGVKSEESSAPSYAWGVPVDQVAAGDLRAGDVVPFEAPNLKARRVERVVLVVGRVVVPLGLDVADAVRVTLAVDSLLARPGKAAC
jgi:hypothetical protein